MIVSKFGGTSVGSAKNIKKVVQIISDKKDKTIVVISAIGGITNLLTKSSALAKNNDKNYLLELDEIKKIHHQIVNDLFNGSALNEILDFINAKITNLESLLNGVFTLQDLSNKTLASILSFGEILSSKIVTATFQQNEIDAILKDSRKLIITNNNYLNASVNFNLTLDNINKEIKQCSNKVIIVAGFISSSKDKETTTLGRGGSDYTASIFANAVNASILEIWTDVSGMFTANPKIVKQAKPIKEISYQEAMELSHFGAKVIYPPTIQPVLEKNIPILIKNTLRPKEKGTLIHNKTNNKKKPVKGISHIDHIALLTLEGNGMVGVPGISKRLFESLSQLDINIKFITQASSEHSICLAIDENDTVKAKTAVDKQFEFEIFQHKVNPLVIEKDLVIIALVGDNMKSHQGISGKMFSELGNNNVNIRAIAQGSTEKNISAVIAKKNIKKALNILHSAFFENQVKQVNLFIVGIGNVGSKLLEQINNQQKYLQEHLHLNIRVIAISNSKKMLFDVDGINLNTWSKNLIKNGEKANLNTFYQQVKQLNLRNSIFIDNTANEFVPLQYSIYLKNSISVVACNKIACSSNFKYYKELKNLSKKFNASFLFETNVGAGLPIINTLNNLIASGDEITKIQAVLSGSLNFIFNNYKDNKSFYEVVKTARNEGYTEPDPRIDLSGIDVMRKILILIRESGIKMELDDIANDGFLPDNCLKTKSVDGFMQSLIAEEDHFNKLRANAYNNNNRLKYVAEYDKGKAKVGLIQVAKEHPFYNLDGKDNIVLFYTNRYTNQPLIIKGAGAGAEVTASGIFGDIIKTVNK